MSIPQFVDELPPSSRGHHFKSPYAEFLGVLRENPRRWAKAPQEKATAARAWARVNNLESATRGGVVFVRTKERG